MKKFNFIWLGYADLMTSLFFVMLVIFSLSSIWYLKQIKELKDLVNTEETFEKDPEEVIRDLRDSLQVTKSKYEKINEITAALDRMSDDNYFKFNEGCKRHELVHGSLFEKSSFEIENDQKPRLNELGKQLANIINQVRKQDGIQYMLVIEGRAGKFEDETINTQYNSFAKRLSYERAKALFDLWSQSGITFDEEICQVIISGSGYGGACRYTGSQEEKNKTFIIQLIPKVGEI